MSKIDETNQMLLQESKDRRKNLDDPLKSLYSLFKSQYSMNTFAEIKNELLIIGFFPCDTGRDFVQAHKFGFIFVSYSCVVLFI